MVSRKEENLLFGAQDESILSTFDRYLEKT